MPSCRGMHLIDNDQLIVLEDGTTNVFVCTVEMQKRTFQEKMQNSKKKIDEVKTVKINEGVGA